MQGAFADLLKEEILWHSYLSHLSLTSSISQCLINTVLKYFNSLITAILSPPRTVSHLSSTGTLTLHRIHHLNLFRPKHHYCTFSRIHPQLPLATHTMKLIYYSFFPYSLSASFCYTHYELDLLFFFPAITLSFLLLHMLWNWFATLWSFLSLYIYYCYRKCQFHFSE